MAKKKSVKRTSKKTAVSRIVSSESCPMCAPLHARTQKLNACDISMIKFASASFILFLITVWPAAMNFVHSIHWGWWLALTILFSLKPFAKVWL